MLNFGGMFEADIFIEGQIGNTVKEGKIVKRGVELPDVMLDVSKHKGATKLNFHINSPGGYVRVGKAIREYIAGLPNAYTIAHDCASMGTEIHLAVPIERRSKIEGKQYLIHNPSLTVNEAGSYTQDDFHALAEDIGETQNEMVSMYAKATGMEKSSLQQLMKQETSLTDEQCKEFGFVSQVIPATELRAVAYLEPKQTSNTIDMSEVKKDISWIKTALASITEKFKGEKVALDATTKDGFKIVIDTAEDAPKVGDKAMDENGKSLDPGKYETQWGTLVVVDGSIAEIIAPVAAENPEMEALKTELAALKAEREAEQAEIAALKTDVEAMAKLTSTYVPKTQKVAFKKVETSTEKEPKKSIKDAYAEKKAAAKK